MKNKKLQKKYLNNPDVCPFCNSENISGDEFDALDTIAYRNVICRDCTSEWTEVFNLVEIDNIINNYET